MKRIYCYSIGLLACAAVLFGCSKAEEAEGADDNEVRISAVHPDAVTKANDAGFESGDKIGLYMTEYDGDEASLLEVAGAYASNVGGTFDGSSWSLSPKVYWWDGKYDFYGYYPYMSVSSIDDQLFEVAADQNSAVEGSDMGGYEASDFLWAKSAGLTRTGSVSMVFRHRMSKMVVKLVKADDYEGDLPSNASVRILNTVPVARIDLSTGDVVKDPKSSEGDIIMHKVSDDTYEAIVVPQRLTYRVPLIEVYASGVSYLVESRFVFRSGVQHTVSVTLSDNPEKIKIEIGGEIEDWSE